MVKLQKHFAYTYKDKKHYKHMISIPEEFIEKLGWKDGIELQIDVSNNDLIFKKNNKKKKRD